MGDRSVPGYRRAGRRRARLGRVGADAARGVADVHVGVERVPADAVPAGRAHSAGQPPVVVATAVAGGMPDPASVEPRRGLRASPATPAVLYIEDHPVNVELMRGAFVALWPHLHLQTAGTGTAGLDHIRADPPDLVLLDGNVVDVDGCDVLSQIRADPATATLPVIVISSDARPSRAVELLALGANEYLFKPLHFGHLGRLVTALTVGQRAGHPTARAPGGLVGGLESRMNTNPAALDRTTPIVK